MPYIKKFCLLRDNSGRYKELIKNHKINLIPSVTTKSSLTVASGFASPDNHSNHPQSNQEKNRPFPNRHDQQFVNHTHHQQQNHTSIYEFSNDRVNQDECREKNTDYALASQNSDDSSFSPISISSEGGGSGLASNGNSKFHQISECPAHLTIPSVVHCASNSNAHNYQSKSQFFYSNFHSNSNVCPKNYASLKTSLPKSFLQTPLFANFPVQLPSNTTPCCSTLNQLAISPPQLTNQQHYQPSYIHEKLQSNCSSMIFPQLTKNKIFLSIPTSQHKPEKSEASDNATTSSFSNNAQPKNYFQINNSAIAQINVERDFCLAAAAPVGTTAATSTSLLPVGLNSVANTPEQINRASLTTNSHMLSPNVQLSSYLYDLYIKNLHELPLHSTIKRDIHEFVLKQSNSTNQLKNKSTWRKHFKQNRIADKFHDNYVHGVFNHAIKSKRKKKPARRNRSIKGTQFLWQYIISLLENPEDYVHIVKWYDWEKPCDLYVEKPNELASMWGSNPNRKNQSAQMNYDNLSRSMRQYYLNGILEQPKPPKNFYFKFNMRDKDVREELLKYRDINFSLYE